MQLQHRAVIALQIVLVLGTQVGGALAEGVVVRSREAGGAQNAGGTPHVFRRHEKIKVWKGEPFERAMANFYLGLIYYMRHDYNNARGAFENALFKLRDYGEGKDKKDEYRRVESNFALACVMLEPIERGVQVGWDDGAEDAEVGVAVAIALESGARAARERGPEQRQGQSQHRLVPVELAEAGAEQRDGAQSADRLVGGVDQLGPERGALELHQPIRRQPVRERPRPPHRPPSGPPRAWPAASPP